ncbi:uncharacterized protein NPIL_340321 [Nephila pilipes]|uniref:Uncharacterized protein n=1 Tax=Nephila pilipes TaxID=299642 RepID=A0A8X6NJN9_NEPPI|nr:uncharacterized protein NPIL_340321 [Nephila pilipes]
MVAVPISKACSGIKRHQLCKEAPILFRGFEDGAGDETIIMDQSFGTSLLRVRSINHHETLIAGFHFLFHAIKGKGIHSTAPGLNFRGNHILWAGEMEQGFLISYPLPLCNGLRRLRKLR